MFSADTVMVVVFINCFRLIEWDMRDLGSMGLSSWVRIRNCDCRSYKSEIF